MPDKHKTAKQLIMDCIGQGVFDAFGDAVSIQDTDFKVLCQNQSHKNMLGEHIGEYCYKAYQGKDNVCENCQLAMSFKDGKVHKMEQVRDTDDGIFHYELTAYPLKDLSGKIMAGMEVLKDIDRRWKAEAALQDIAERKKAEITLRQSEEKYRCLLDFTSDSIYLVDQDYKYLFINKQHLSRLGLSEEQYINKAYSDFHSPEETELFIQKADKVLKSDEPFQFDYKSFRDGRCFVQTISPVRDFNSKTTSIAVISKDITAIKQAAEKLYYISITDELTGLYNRRGFLALSEQQLKLAARENKKMFLMSADLDFLKLINDTIGHQKGDMAIINIANILKETFRESDIVARIGGDEFVVFGADTPETNIETLVDRLRENLNAHNDKANEPLGELSLSYGFIIYDPRHPHSIEELLSEADKLMYQHKSEKR